MFLWCFCCVVYFYFRWGHMTLFIRVWQSTLTDWNKLMCTQWKRIINNDDIYGRLIYGISFLLFLDFVYSWSFLFSFAVADAIWILSSFQRRGVHSLCHGSIFFVAIIIRCTGIMIWVKWARWREKGGEAFSTAEIFS